VNASLAARFLTILFTASLKASFIFLVVCFAARLLRDSLPQLRHLLWLGAIFSYLIILLLSLFGPVLLPMHVAGSASWDGISRTVSEVLLTQGVLSVPAGAGSPSFGAAEAGLRTGIWACSALSAWVAGVLVSFLRVAIGSVKLRRLVIEARRRSACGGQAQYGQQLRDLAEVGASRRVRVLQSLTCRVPYAGGVWHPFIMLPASARAWPRQRLHAVLLHELRHVERWDCLTQAAARWICALFWFVPFTWIAYSFLYAEQEKACDASVVENGVAPGDYASCILDAVRLCPQPAPFASLYSPAWRKRILEERIRNILEGGRAVKKRWLVFALSALVVCALVVAGGCVRSRRVSDAEAYQRFVGTFVNTAYPGTLSHSQVSVIRPDYVGEDWLFPDSAKPDGQWKIKVKRTWVDRAGNTYCQFYSSYIAGYYADVKRTSRALMRVDKAGKVWECFSVCGSEGEAGKYPEPENLIKGAPEYYIYYRK